MNSLKLFNAVLESNIKGAEPPYIDNNLGLIIEQDALWAKDQIIDYYKKEKLAGNELNQTFHKSWQVIENDDKFAILVEQLKHYISAAFIHDPEDELHIPGEYLDVPGVKELTYKVIKAYTKEDLAERGLDLLRSGIALKSETIEEIISLVGIDCDYQFTGNEGIRNKEAIIKIADIFNVLPVDVMEFFRYIIYRATNETLLIKNAKMIHIIKESDYNPGIQFKTFGLEKLATIFNRFKPLFLAFKTRCPSVINKISKLSKTHHIPLVTNPINEVTHRVLEDSDMHWLDNATPYALFKALSACYIRAEGQTSFVYRIRNGKSWITEKSVTDEAARMNYAILLEYVKQKFEGLKGRKIFLPEDVSYALPTSEKMYVGNIPTGTVFSGEKLAIGIYWKNSWGAHDLDLSGLNIGGKVGWNATYNQGRGNLMYSGDIIDAPMGAVEYLYANSGLIEPTLVMNNVYSGEPDCDYKIIIGRGDKISEPYMMDPNNLFMETKCQSVEKQMILGIVIPAENDTQKFVLLNFGAGSAHVSAYGQRTDIATKALYEQWNNPLSFNWLVEELGAELVKDVDEADFNFSLSALDKDTFTKFFE